MTTLKPIKNWAYPLKLNGTAPKFAPAGYFEGLAKALGGTYPLGGNGLLHPAVHFDLGSAICVDTRAVYAIADGQIVAYRMDAAPLTMRYPENPALVPYTSSFVLIKHKLQLPPKPVPPAPTPTPGAATPATPAAPAPAPVEPASITLYSLYMHLLDAKAYKDQPDLIKPSYLPVTYKVKADRVKSVKGLRVRVAPGKTAAVLAIIPNLSTINVGAVHPSNPKWKKFTGTTGTLLTEASPMPAGKTPTSNGYVFVGSVTADTLQVKNEQDSEPTCATPKVAWVYPKAKDVPHPHSSDPTVLANLPAGAILTLGDYDRENHRYPIKSATALLNFPPLVADAHGIMGWIDSDDVEAQPLKASGNVELVSPPYDIKAGELIGHPGHYQHHNNATPQIQLLIECFTPMTCQPLSPKAEPGPATPNVAERDKTLLKVPSGTKLITPKVTDGGELVIPVTTPPTLTAAGTPTHSELILPLSALNALPNNYKMLLPESAAADAKKVRWWYLDNVAGQASGTAFKGWLCESSTCKISPWEWHGFTCLQDYTEDKNLIAYQLKQANKIRPEETAYNGIVATGEGLPVIGKLMEIITGNKVADIELADKLPSAQVTDANKGFWCPQKIASIAVKTQSERKKDDGRWRRLDILLGERHGGKWVFESKNGTGY